MGATHDADDVLRRAAAWRAEGAALATVVETWGSSPRPAGSLLAVSAAGEMAGSVSGGCVEGAVVESALQVIASGEPALLEFGVTNEQAWEVGLACGGRIRVRVERVGAETLVDELLAARAAKRPVALAIGLETGERRLVQPDDPDAALRDAARRALATDTPVLCESPAGRVFVQPFDAPLRLLIVGGVHIAQPLASMARETGYEVVVVDPRRAFANAERFPGTLLRHEWPDEALAALGVDHRCAVVTLTHDAKLDDPALDAALRSDAFYVGALGSRKTQAARRERLRERGFDDAALARIHGPIGLDIGARSPAEIAIAILAEMTERLRKAAA